MKRIIKLLTAITLGFILITFLLIQYLKSDFNTSFAPADIISIQSEIKSAKALPDQFFQVYNDITPIVSTSEQLFNWFLSNFSGDCPCLHVASFNRNIAVNNVELTGNRFVLSWKIEKGVTQRQCLNFLASKYDFLYTNIGIENASRFYFNRKVDSLTKKQMQILTLMLKNPSQYNPKRYPKIVDQKLKELNN